MRRYFINLWLAVAGNNPYKQELEEIKRKYSENLAHLNSVRDKYDVLIKQVVSMDAQLINMQKLVENLRGRINDKNEEFKTASLQFSERIERMKADYQHRLDEYNKKIEELQRPLPQP